MGIRVVEHHNEPRRFVVGPPPPRIPVDTTFDLTIRRIHREIDLTTALWELFATRGDDQRCESNLNGVGMIV